MKSLGKASATVFDLETARTLFAKDGYDRILVAGTRASSTPGPGTEVRSAADDDRFYVRLAADARGHPAHDPARVRRRGRASSARSRSSTRSRSPSRSARRSSGCCGWSARRRRQVRAAVLLEALLIGLLASGVGIGVGVALAAGLQRALHRGRPASCRPRASRSPTRTIVVSLARRHAGHAAGGGDPGPARDEDRAGGRAARRRQRRSKVAAVRPRRARRGERRRPPGGRDRRRRRPARPPQRDAQPGPHRGHGQRADDRRRARDRRDRRRPGPRGRRARGALERHVQASTIVTAADGWSPIDPKIERAVAGVGTVSSVRQDGALVFGHQEGVNGVDPAIDRRPLPLRLHGGPRHSDPGRDGAIVDDGLREGARAAASAARSRSPR